MGSRSTPSILLPLALYSIFIPPTHVYGAHYALAMYNTLAQKNAPIIVAPPCIAITTQDIEHKQTLLANNAHEEIIKQKNTLASLLERIVVCVQANYGLDKELKTRTCEQYNALTERVKHAETINTLYHLAREAYELLQNTNSEVIASVHTANLPDPAGKMSDIEKVIAIEHLSAAIDKFLDKGCFEPHHITLQQLLSWSPLTEKVMTLAVACLILKIASTTKVASCASSTYATPILVAIAATHTDQLKTAGKDLLKFVWNKWELQKARLQGYTLHNGDPVKPDTMKLADLPATEDLQRHIRLLPEELRQQRLEGKGAFKTMFITGDITLADNVARAIAGHITESYKKDAHPLKCGWASVRIINLTADEPLEKTLTNIAWFHPGEACVLVIHGFDQLKRIDSDVATSVMKDITNTIKRVTSPTNKNIIIIGTAPTADDVDPIFRAVDAFPPSSWYHLDVDDITIFKQCVACLEKTYNVAIHDQLHPALKSCLKDMSFEGTKELFKKERFDTHRIAKQPFTSQAVEHILRKKGYYTGPTLIHKQPTPHTHAAPATPGPRTTIPATA